MTAGELGFVSPGDRVLVFGRRRNFSRVRKMGRELFPECRIDLWSGERLGGSSVEWWGRAFYREYEELEDGGYEHSLPAEVDSVDIDDVVSRCRILRLLDPAEGRARAAAGVRAWHSILRDREYSFALLLPVDSFVLDTLERTARSLGVPALYPVGSPFTGRIRFTDRGRLLGTISLDDEESEDLQRESDRLREDHFRPGWLFGVDSSPSRTVLRRLIWDMAKTLPYAAYRILARDPKSFSFAPYRLQRKSKWSTPGKALAALRAERDSVEELPSDFAFVPLQMYPEASTDYWIRELSARPTPEAIIRLVKALSREMPVVVKEHPAVVGRRPARILEALRSMENVDFAPLLAPVGALIQKAGLVAGPGSTSMFQAVVNQKRTLFLGTPYYGAGGAPIIRDVDNEEEVATRIRDAIESDPPSKQTADDVLRRLFVATAPADLAPAPPFGEARFGQSGEPEISPIAVELLNSAVRELRADVNPG